MNKFTMAVSKFMGRKGLILAKKSPEILMVVGGVGAVTATVLACKATLKFEGVVDEIRTDIEKAHVARTMAPEKYSEKDLQKDLAIVYAQGAVKIANLYFPAVAVGAFSFGCLIGSHKILKNRNIALAAAYKALDATFKTYRGRVVEELGSEKDMEFRHGIRKETIVSTTTDENGKKVKTKEVVESMDPNNISLYAKFFDEYNPNWEKNAELNLHFLKTQQNYANDLLKIRGHLFLNEVYDMLDIKHTTAGALCGWVLGSGEGDGYVDFGLYNSERETVREFVNGEERSILLDFNVDGPIYDLI